MARPSGRDTNDKPLDSPQPESENQFIRFRRFADAQVSSLLQGIIGLPSAFSKKPSNENRWTDIDGDLCRRDQSQARLQYLQEEEAKKSSGKTEYVEVDIPVKRSSPTEISPSLCAKNSSWVAFDTTKDAFQGGMTPVFNLTADLPLYSPVTPELFARLRRPGDDSSHDKITYLPFDGLPLDPLGATRRFVFENVKRNPIYRSDYSLLPYLLFSRYSPLKLAEEARAPTNARTLDQFPYCAAFEDLIQITQGRPRRCSSIASQAGLSHLYNTAWISSLHYRGMLQQKTSVPILESTPLASFIERGTDTQDGSPGTELDMMDRLLSLISTTATAHATFRTIFDALHDEQPSEAPRLNHLEDLIAQARERGEAQSRMVADLAGEKPSFEQQKERSIDQKTDKGARDRDRVVSTTTITERTIHEDGVVQTSVTVQKLFGDGRETTSRTSHIEDPGWDEEEPVTWVREAADYKTGENETEKKNEKKKVEKGWFWN